MQAWRASACSSCALSCSLVADVLLWKATPPDLAGASPARPGGQCLPIATLALPRRSPGMGRYLAR
jgi:hypothetical protein